MGPVEIMRVLDRYVIKTFAVNYIISLMVLLSVYVVLDLFFNFDEFVQNPRVPLAQVMHGIGIYYGSHLFLYFSQTSGVITLFAMLFTLARMQRNNELVAIVASGVSLYRIAGTVIGVGLALNALWWLNQECILPSMAPQLAQNHEATVLNQPYGVWFLRDRNGMLLSASQFDPARSQLRRLVVIQPGRENQSSRFLLADQAEWSGTTDSINRWQLKRGALMEPQADDQGGTQVETRPALLLESSLSPHDIALQQSSEWIQFLDSRRLMQIRDAGMCPSEWIDRALNNRFATPFVNMLILMIGLPFFLDRRPGGVVQRGGKCLLLCGACFMLAFASQNLSSSEYPTLVAWLPMIVLTPVVVISLDRMKT